VFRNVTKNSESSCNITTGVTFSGEQKLHPLACNITRTLGKKNYNHVILLLCNNREPVSQGLRDRLLLRACNFSYLRTICGTPSGDQRICTLTFACTLAERMVAPIRALSVLTVADLTLTFKADKRTPLPFGMSLIACTSAGGTLDLRPRWVNSIEFSSMNSNSNSDMVYP